MLGDKNELIILIFASVIPLQVQTESSIVINLGKKDPAHLPAMNQSKKVSLDTVLNLCLGMNTRTYRH